MDKITKKIIGAGYEKRSGQILIPKYFLELLGVKVGDNVSICCDKNNKKIIIEVNENECNWIGGFFIW